MTSQTVQQIITIRILSNILRGKGNQAIKFSQLIEYKMRNIFFENFSQNRVEKLVRDPFIKIKTSLNQQSEML